MVDLGVTKHMTQIDEGRSYRRTLAGTQIIETLPGRMLLELVLINSSYTHDVHRSS